MGRLTLRKFFLLLTEHLIREADKDLRAYRILSVHYKEPPDAGVFFPLLARGERSAEEEDDAEIFSQISSSVIPD